MSEFKEISTKDLHKSIDRLTTLADYMRDNVKKSNFYLDSFLEHEAHSMYGTPEELKKIRVELKEGFCGTTACAIGHACMIPDFQKKGLKVRILEPAYGDKSRLACSFKSKDGKIVEDFYAAEKFFKISERRAELLFSGDGYQKPGKDYINATKSMVVKAIRDYVYRAKKHLAKRERAD